MLEEIRARLETIAADQALVDEASYSGRAEALDALEVHVFDRLDGLAQTAEHVALRHSAERLRSQLASVDAKLFRRLRADIRDGACRGPALREAIEAYVGPELLGGGPDTPAGYSDLDTFLDGVLGIAAIPAATAALAPEMVPYQKTPARVMLRLIEFAGLTERSVFYDLGSGLGHVPIMAHLLTGAHATGVEVEPAYCEAARAAAAGLDLAHVTFAQGDARLANYTGGTHFFLYTPFQGRMLDAVLARLSAEARARPLRLVTFGPCTPHVARQPWLACEQSHQDAAGELAVFRSR